MTPRVMGTSTIPNDIANAKWVSSRRADYAGANPPYGALP